MPTSIVLDSSLLLTSQGWLPCGLATGGIAAAGVDRHGKVTIEDVGARRSGKTSNIVFIGTTRSCGMFSPRTMIQDAEGRCWPLNQIVQEGLIGDLKFEQVLRLKNLDFGELQREMVWRTLQSAAAFNNESIASIRCRGKVTVEKQRGTIGIFRKIDGARMYYQIAKATLIDALASDASLKVVDEIELAFRNDEDAVELERSSFYFAVMFAARAAIAEKSYDLHYDALQHTAAINLQNPSSDDSALGKGRCCHLLATAAEEWTISWTSASWNPLCSGLVAVSGKR